VREPQLTPIVAPDVAAMRSIGASLARASTHVEQPFVIALEGELGAGKTTLVGGFLSALGFRGHARSPTYTLIEPYEFGDRSVYHLDLYRLADFRDVEALGLRDLLQPRSIFLIEWPERGAGALPSFDLTVRIRYARKSGREIELLGHSKLGQSAIEVAWATAKP
jgi:tRNA threonylcarbamoyladenosine biosynthesis protein TsaE